MDTITIKAPAKINLSLDIVGRREDGYHLLKTVMQAITLFDTVTVARTDTAGIRISCDRADIPCGPSNIAHKAAVAFFSAAGITSYGIDIHIKKMIPAQAGLGGGSADGAAVIVALNQIYEVNFTDEQLRVIGLTVGADIPFCLVGGTALAEGIGEILTPLHGKLDAYLVVCKPPIGVSTAVAYRKFDESGTSCSLSTENLMLALATENVKEIAQNTSNAFEQLLDLPEVKQLECEMRAHGALTAVMSGSGSAVYGVFDSKSKAEMCATALKEKYNEAFLCAPYAGGCTIEKAFSEKTE